MTTHDRFATFDGAYVLGALSEEDREAYEEHLLECDECAASVRDLGDLPRLLATVSPAQIATIDDEAPPISLLPAIERRVRRERVRKRWIMSSIAAVAAACLVVVSVAIARQDSGGTVHHPVAMSAATPVPIEATAEVRDVVWGTEINLVCRYYSSDQTTSRPYRLVVVDRSGQRHELGTWNLVPGQETTYRSGTALRRADIAAVDITTITGKPLLTLAL